MSPPGYVFKDSGLTPQEEKLDPNDSTPAATTQQNTPTSSDSEKAARIDERSPTRSHALAAGAGSGDHDEKGVAQLHDGVDVKDLGWRDHPKDVPAPLVSRLPNEELWTLVRRFNKVCN